MELNNSFEVTRPISEAWEVLTDVERIAPCLPGAKLEEVKGDDYLGSVKVKVGPITAQYRGTATFVEKDDDNHRALLKADGRDTRGAGNASAMITAQLEEVGDSATKVDVFTDLTITGKVAQFGRGVMADVSAKLMGQFADNLEAMLTQDSAAVAGEVGAREEVTEGATAAAMAEPAEVEALDLVEVAGGSVAKRVVPVLLLALVAILIAIARGRNRGSGASTDSASR